MAAPCCRTFATCLILALLLLGGARADDHAKAEKTVKEFLVQKKANAVPTLVADEALGQAFPDQAFFAVIFRQYPVAIVPPEPFKSRNLLVVPKVGKLVPLTDTAGLETFFKDNLKPVKSEEAARQATAAWLALTQTFQQDGFFKFSIARDDLKAEPGGRKAVGKFVVVQGGKGELKATLSFDESGKLAKVSEDNTIKPGIRPICQATKLLDADPLVRRMAEQDLLVMGRACREYLDEQRAQAGSELRKAIDRVWGRIVDEGW